MKLEMIVEMMMSWRVHNFLVEGPLDWIDVGVSKSGDVDEKDGWIGGMVSAWHLFIATGRVFGVVEEAG